jgi:hypothetical protein
VLLRVCLRSNLRRETGRWPSVFLLGKSRLRFAASGPHSPPRWRTRGRRCDLSLYPSDEDLSPGTPSALARKERFREHVWPVKLPLALGISAPSFSRTGLSLRFRRQDTRIEAFLRNLLTIARNPGGVNASILMRQILPEIHAIRPQHQGAV